MTRQSSDESTQSFVTRSIRSLHASKYAKPINDLRHFLRLYNSIRRGTLQASPIQIVLCPIAWIVTLDHDGHLNTAPFSFFNAFATDPPVVGVGIGSYDPGRPKDTRRNIRETGQFVINLVPEQMARSMNITAINFEPGVSELAEAELDSRPSIHVKTPRIAGSSVAMECELMQIVDLGTDPGLVLGRVLAMHVREDVIIDPAKHYIDTPRLRLIGRRHAGWYARTSDLFQMERNSRDDWQARARDI